MWCAVFAVRDRHQPGARRSEISAESVRPSSRVPDCVAGAGLRCPADSASRSKQSSVSPLRTSLQALAEADVSDALAEVHDPLAWRIAGPFTDPSAHRWKRRRMPRLHSRATSHECTADRRNELVGPGKVHDQRREQHLDRQARGARVGLCRTTSPPGTPTSSRSRLTLIPPGSSRPAGIWEVDGWWPCSSRAESSTSCKSPGSNPTAASRSQPRRVPCDRTRRTNSSPPTAQRASLAMSTSPSTG